MLTELRSDLWEGVMKMDLHSLKEKERFFLNFTVRDRGEIRGMFEVVSLIPFKDNRGFRQKVFVRPWVPDGVDE